MARKPRKIPGMTFPPRHPEWLRPLLRHPQGIDALHEGSHAVVHTLLGRSGFESVDIKMRTRETHPEAGILPGSYSRGFTNVVWPDTITKGYCWSRALGAVAPGVTAQLLGYKDDGVMHDQVEVVQLANDLGIDQQELLRTAWRLTGGIVQNTCVLATIINTAERLLDQAELFVDDVSSILETMQAGWPELVSPLPPEVLVLITRSDLIVDHDRVVAQVKAQRSRAKGGATP
jgi:hypothetical protein